MRPEPERVERTSALFVPLSDLIGPAHAPGPGADVMDQGPTGADPQRPQHPMVASIVLVTAIVVLIMALSVAGAVR